MLVVMGPIMEIPVTDLFAAAILPGILLACLYAAYTTVRCMINPKLGPTVPEELRAKSMKAVWIEFFWISSTCCFSICRTWKYIIWFCYTYRAAGCGAAGSLY